MHQQAPIRSPYRLTFCVLVVAMVAFALLQMLISPVLPVIREDLDTDQTTITWLITV